MQNDTTVPRRMPIDEYRNAVMELFLRIWAEPAAMSRALRDSFRDEADGLLGWQIAKELVDMLHRPPYVCQCGALFRTSLPPVWCDACQKLAEQEQRESAIRADERAKVLAEQKAATEAEVSADLAQKGEF